MRSIEKTYKILLLLTLNLAFIPVGAVVSLWPGYGSRMRIRAACMQGWAKISCSILGIKVSTSGVPLSQRGALIVANHCSYIDILVLGSMVPAAFVAKNEISSWFPVGLLARMAGTVFVNRNSRMSAGHSMAEIEQCLSSGTNVILFPEGTTNNGRDLLDFKSSFFQIPAENCRQVVPVSISYVRVNCHRTSLPPEDIIAWYGDMALLPHVWKLLGTLQIHVHIRGHEPIGRIGHANQPRSRKQIALHAYESIKSGCEAMRAA